jgi:hypothetical protein
LQTETAEQWIKPFSKRQSGRDDMEALIKHYSGEGNTSHRIAVAERLRDSLHYKNEKSLQFSTFLDKLQRMFNIFEEENEAITEAAKVRMLLQKVEHPQLQDAMGALRVRSQMEGITFRACANHLSAIVSEFPDHQTPRKVTATKNVPIMRGRGGGRNQKPNSAANQRKGIHMPDSSIWTGYYLDWEKMSETDKSTVMETRKKNKAKGISHAGKGKSNDLKFQVAELKLSIAALQNNPSNDGSKASSSVTFDISDNAGEAFGGRNAKKKKE